MAVRVGDVVRVPGAMPLGISTGSGRGLVMELEARVTRTAVGPDGEVLILEAEPMWATIGWLVEGE